MVFFPSIVAPKYLCPNINIVRVSLFHFRIFFLIYAPPKNTPNPKYPPVHK